MKMKGIIAASLLAGSLLSAQSSFEVAPMLGYKVLDSDLYMKNHIIGGAEVQYNGFDSAVKPELSFMYGQPDAKTNKRYYNSFEGSLNGVYDFKKVSVFTPFAKLGLGAGAYTSPKTTRDLSLFGNAGLGAKVLLTKKLALKLEGLYQPTYSNEEMYNNFSLFTGLNIPFGKAKSAYKECDLDHDGVFDGRDKCLFTPPNTIVDENGCKKVEKKVAIAPVKKAPVVIDSDKDGVIDSLDKCADTPLNTEVDANGCAIVVDSDNDGVNDNIDKCPNTPFGVKVDANGCKVVDVEKELESVVIHFAYKNTKLVPPKVRENLDKLINTLKANPDIKVKVLGYTDSIGSKEYNLKLSQKRADKVKKILVEEGIEADRIIAFGMGESNPVATNMYKAGRAQNRRIEVRLVK